jgi:beta-mannosidase
MQKLLLDGHWKVSYVSFNEKIDHVLEDCFVPEGWLDAYIPEDIHATLRRAGYIKGHYYGKDLEEERWIEEVDWIYFKEFYVSDDLKQEKVIIEFEGLDTFCDIYLNGEKIAFGNNMFIPVVVDVKSKLRYNARNVLVVRFYSPVKYVEGMDTTGLFSTTTLDRILARKAQMNYSWDFCGRCVTIGIWKPVSVKAYNHNFIEDYYIYTEEITDGKAIVGLEVNLNQEVESLEGYLLEAQLLKDGCVVCQVEGDKDVFKALKLEVENPRLWWPRPYGKAELYDFRLVLKKNGEIVDSVEQKFGIRTVEIVQEPQEDGGTSFIFKVNGKCLFVRGANWVPLNVVYTDIKEEEYEEMIDFAVEGNISMLRVWGGGIYEPLKFFELCDEKGIMVFQDFMFACGIYPQNQEFLDNAYKEAVYVIKKYRNCTSLVLWSGDNENDEAYTWAGRPTEFVHDKLNKITLKSACEKFDPHRIFIPSSPHSPFPDRPGGDNPKSDLQGDTHIYVHYKKIKDYRPRFLSEFGAISLPEKDTYFKFNFLRKKLENFERFANRLLNVDDYLGDGSDHEKVIYYTQVYNSYVLKYWIEHLRILKWICAGSLYWKFNDPVADNNKGMIFPTLMSTVDFYKKPKMTYYYTKRAYEDIILAFNRTESKLEIYSCSEVEQSYSGDLIIRHMDFEGQIYSEKRVECVIKPDASTLLYTLDLNKLDVKDEYNEYIKVSFEGSGIVLENRYLFVDIEEFYKLKFKDAGLFIKDVKKEGDELVVTLSTQNYARNVRLNILDYKAHYQDNYFDMDANTEKTVRIKLCGGPIHDKLLYIEGRNVKRICYTLDKV